MTSQQRADGMILKAPKVHRRGINRKAGALDLHIGIPFSAAASAQELTLSPSINVILRC